MSVSDLGLTRCIMRLNLSFPREILTVLLLLDVSILVCNKRITNMLRKLLLVVVVVVVVVVVSRAK